MHFPLSYGVPRALAVVVSAVVGGCIAEPSGMTGRDRASGKGETIVCPDNLGAVLRDLFNSFPEGYLAITEDNLSIWRTIWDEIKGVANQTIESFEGRELNIEILDACLTPDRKYLADQVAELLDAVQPSAAAAVGGEFCPEYRELTESQLEYLRAEYAERGATLTATTDDNVRLRYQPIRSSPASEPLFRLDYCPVGQVNRPLGSADDWIISPERTPTDCFCGPPGIMLGYSDTGFLGNDNPGVVCGDICEATEDCARGAGGWQAGAFATHVWTQEITGTSENDPQSTFFERFVDSLQRRRGTRSDSVEIEEQPIPPHEEPPPYGCERAANRPLGMCVRSGRSLADWTDCDVKFREYYETVDHRTAAILGALHAVGLAADRPLP